MSWRLSRMACRLFGHRWSQGLYTQVCTRSACHGHTDAIRWPT